MAWSELKYALNSTLGTPEFESLDTLVKRYGDESIETMKSYSPIRHIQRGRIYHETTNVKVTLSGFSNLNKMIVLLDGKKTKDKYSNLLSSLPVFTVALKALTIICEGEDIYGTELSYQVIEFY